MMLVFGIAVVVNRNPVASALSLVVSFLGLAALFMSLDAYFIGISTTPDQLAGLGRRNRSCARFGPPDFLCCWPFKIRWPTLSTARTIDHRRRSQYRRAAFQQLQSAVSNHRRSCAGGNDWSGPFEQTRASIAW